MSKVVDPYYEWLGIPPKDQPPNHYRLLGLELFEENRNVIDAAANRQMGFIKDYQAGPSSDLTQQVLNELSAARICLLTPKRKAAYDSKLKQELEPLQPTEAAETEVLGDLVTAELVAPAMPPRFALPSAPDSEGVRPSVIVVAASVAIGCILTGVVVGCMLLWLLGDDSATSEEIARQDAMEEGAVAVETLDEPEQDTTFTREETVAVVPETELDRMVATVDPDVSTLIEDVDSAVESDEQAPVLPAGDSGDTGPLADGPIPVDGQSSPESEIVAAGDFESTANDEIDRGLSTTRVARLPVPNLDLQQRITREVSSFYEVDTQSESRKRQLSQELLELGRDPRETPERRFVLLRLVAQMAGEIGDCETMFAAVDDIEGVFDVQGSSVKAKLLLQMLDQADDTALVMVFLRNYDGILAELLDDNDFELAGRLSSTATSLCDRPIGSREFRQEIIDRHATIETMLQDYAHAREAIAAVQRNSEDSDANLTVGRWLCFVKNDWTRGLTHLANGSDEGLRLIAQSELQAPPQESADVFRLADRWWELAQEASELDRRSMLLHAGHWYAQIDTASASGMDRVKLERRLTDIDRVAGGSFQTSIASLGAASETENSNGDIPATDSDLASVFSRGLSAALEEHDFQQAERFFGRCVDMNSQHVPSLNNRALANLRCDNTRGAIRSFELAIDLAPDTKQVAHNMALLTRLINDGKANLDTSTRQKLDALMAVADVESSYRLERGFVYMPFDGDLADSRSLVDCTCLACNGVGRMNCPVRGCTRGTVGSTRSEVVGRNTVSGQAIIKVRPIRVPCTTCRGRGTVDCPHCSNGVVSSLD